MNENYYYQPIEKPKGEALALASFILGIVSILSAAFVIPSFICGPLAIIFALLSRGTGRMNGRALTGLIIGSIGLCIVTVMTVQSIIYIYQNPDVFREILQEYEQELQQLR
ncbi:MAG: hypothetical protein K5989_06060 [Lachnospiraceae bacterium]|nr:hypothetical protein [Lachnospiraceae bacterium]